MLRQNCRSVGFTSKTHKSILGCSTILDCQVFNMLQPLDTAHQHTVLNPVMTDISALLRQSCQRIHKINMKAPHACSLLKVDLSLHPEHSCKKPGLVMCSHTPWFVLGVQWPTSLVEMASFWVTETLCQGNKTKSHRERHQTFFSNLGVYREECTHSHIHAHTYTNTHASHKEKGK